MGTAIAHEECAIQHKKIEKLLSDWSEKHLATGSSSSLKICKKTGVECVIETNIAEAYKPFPRNGWNGPFLEIVPRKLTELLTA